MFPTLNLDNLVEDINETRENESQKNLGKVVLMEFKNNKAQVVLVDGKPKFAETVKEKIKVYIQVLLRTELNKYYIYENTGFGMTYFKYRGQKLPSGFINSELKRELTENLSKISLFDRIENFKSVLNAVNFVISFDVILKDGNNISILL